MFTGIVEAIGSVEQLSARPLGTRRLVVSTALPVAELPMGASIAVSGACLTVVGRRKKGSAQQFEADLGPETLSVTTLGGLKAGDRVHLERPLRLGDPLGGHLVSGHVDALGVVKRRKQEGDALTLWVAVPARLAHLLAEKGSVTIDGVSLTVNQVKGSAFSVTLIPHTLQVTCLGERLTGDRVNIEMDLIAKHIARLVHDRQHK